MEEKLLLREEVKKEDTWNLEDYYATYEDWQKDCEALVLKVPVYDNYRGHLCDRPATLLECLRFDDQVGIKLDKTYTYASQKSDQDTSDSTGVADLGKMRSILTRIIAASSFIRVEITEAGREKIWSFMEEEPELAFYKRVFEEIFRGEKHTKSEAEEKLLASAGEVTGAASDIFRMLNNADMKYDDAIDSEGNAHLVTHGTFIRLLESRDRVLRKSAFESMYRTYRSLKNTLGALYNANLKQHSFYARTRGYDGPLAYSLFQNNIPLSVYDCLLESVHEALPIMYRYVGLRKKFLGVDDLSLYDVYTAVVDTPDLRFTFEEAKAIVLKALAPMGQEYLNIIQEAYDNRWIDVYENKGKRSGAYSTCAYGVHPYMLLNFSGSLDSVFTLAHEMGHSIHSYYSNKNQEYTYANYCIFVAEVASTCNEALLCRYMIDNAANDAEKAYIINHFLDSFKGTIFRQTMFAEFEKITHELAWKEETLTADRLCDIYLELNKLYFGPDMNCDENIAMEWSRIPHFYRPFYVYQYATGFTAAIALSNRILTLGEEGVRDYKKFLSGGCSMDPIDLLKLAGVDMSTKEPFVSAFSVFDDLVNQMSEIVGK